MVWAQGSAAVSTEHTPLRDCMQYVPPIQINGLQNFYIFYESNAPMTPTPGGFQSSENNSPWWALNERNELETQLHVKHDQLPETGEHVKMPWFHLGTFNFLNKWIRR